MLIIFFQEESDSNETQIFRNSDYPYQMTLCKLRHSKEN